ncbi:MAG: hypothetical protein AAF420_15895 [Pseudomonadota bacterium]
MSKILRSTVINYCLLAALSASALAHDGNPDNKLIKAENYGDWEIWCIDYGGTGDIRCNLNLVIVYKPRPDFRAMIPRIYVQGDGYRLEIDKEWQTSFRRGEIALENGVVLSLSDCGSPCVVMWDNPTELFTQLSNNENAKIRFHDYLVEDFNIDFSLRGLPNGLSRLTELHNLFAP